MERFFDTSKKVLFKSSSDEISDQDLQFFLSADEIVNSDVRFARIKIEPFINFNDSRNCRYCDYFTATQVLEVILRYLVWEMNGMDTYKWYGFLLAKMLVPDSPWSKLSIFNEYLVLVRLVNSYVISSDETENLYNGVFKDKILPIYPVMERVINVVDKSRLTSTILKSFVLSSHFLGKYIYLIGRYTDPNVCVLRNTKCDKNSTRLNYSNSFKMGREKYLAEKKKYISSRLVCLRELNILPPPGLAEIVAEYSF
jgi:hypothetical protein